MAEECPHCGHKIPSGGIKLSVYVPNHLWDQVLRLFDGNPKNTSQVIQEALRVYLEAKQKDELSLPA